MNMKKKILGIVAAFLAVIAMPIGAMAAFSSNLLDDPTYSLKENGITYLEQEFNEGGVQKLFYGEYNTTAEDAEYEWVIHSIRDGNKTTLSNVLKIAQDYEAKTGRKVMMATNGDYFFNTGDNVESYVNNGIVLTKGSYQTKHCIGFDNEGKVVVGRLTEVALRVMVVINGERTFFEVDKVNKEPGENEIAIYTNPGTYNIAGAGKYVCASNATNLSNYPVYGQSRRMSVGSVENDDSFTLRSGQFAVVVKGENAQFFYDNVTYGVEVDLVEIPAGKFAGCTWVLGGYDILVDDGTVNTNCHTDNSGDAKAPRTFVGFKEDGTGFLCIVDGRQSGYSLGITVNQEAQLAKVLGAQFAMELDGGGSSTMLIRINDTLTLRNKPSDGSMRSVSNAILLVEKEKPTPEAPVEPEVPETTQPTTQATTPATTPSTPITTTNPTDTGVSMIAVVGAVAGGVVVIALVTVLAVSNHKKRKK